MPLPPFDELLEESIALHGGHGCPGQVLGVKLAMVGLREIGIDDRVAQRKQFLVYVELDRCAADAIQAATGCRVGRRALKVIDYGVMAATFVRLDEDRAVRVIAREDSRQSVDEFTTVEGTKYERQTDAYKHMPEELLFDTQRVSVTVPEEDMPGPPVSRVQCELCGDHVQDRREIRLGERVWCRACSGGAYYSRLEPLHSGMLPSVGRISRSDAVVRHTPLGVPTIGIAGKSKSGKTTLVEGLVMRLAGRGLTVAVLKHSSTGLSVDEAGRDTDRIYAAGATVVMGRDSQQAFSSRRGAQDDWQAATAAAPADADVLIVEGYKAAPIPRIWLGEDATDEFGDVPGIVARIADYEAGLDEADRVVTGLINEAWAARPWGTVGDSSVRLGEDLEAKHPLSPVPGVDAPTARALAAMRWLPGRTWIVLPDGFGGDAGPVIEELRRRRRPGAWSLSIEAGGGTATLLEPPFRRQLEELVRSV